VSDSHPPPPRATRQFEKRRRNLPHWEDPGAVYFITVCARRQVGMVLARADIADVIAAAIHHDDGRRYDLHAYVVMPDHFHMVVHPRPRGDGFVPLSEIMQVLKSVTARRINQLLGRSGRLWQDESYDRIIRDEEEYGSKREYIEANPVTAGLVERTADWPWTWPAPEW